MNICSIRRASDVMDLCEFMDWHAPAKETQLCFSARCLKDTLKHCSSAIACPNDVA